MGIRSYKERKRSFYLITGGLVAAAFVSGLLAGILIPGPPASRPSLREAVDEIIRTGEDIKASLDLVALEYSEGGGEAEAARMHLERAVALFESIKEDLQVLNSTGTLRLSAKLQELQAAIDAEDPPEVVDSLVAEAQLIIDELLSPYRAGGE
jgi:hypothetical protein